MLVVTTLIILFLSLATATRNVNAQFSMPEEQVNYTITPVNGTLWARIDGTYPITYTGTDTAIPMVYPTPPGTTNISVWLNDVELNWSNFTEAYPDVLHHTAIGDWSMISTVLEHVSGRFVLRIHYEHPLQMINGSYVFLYDLNIAEYLSVSGNKSVARFTITLDTNFTNLKVNTVDLETETLKPIDYTVSGEKNAVIKIDEVSEFNKPLTGDLLVSFSNATTSNDDGLLVVVSAFVVGFVLAGSGVYVFLRRRRTQQSR
jgi:hypothetical protein